MECTHTAGTHRLGIGTARIAQGTAAAPAARRSTAALPCALALICICAALLFSCTRNADGARQAAVYSQSNAASPIALLQQAAAQTSAAEQEASPAVAAPQTATPAAAADYAPVDVDLTKLNSTMVYGEVFNMLVEPERYEGKSVRMRGLFYAFDSEYGTGSTSFACVIPDATACCAQGLEFSLAEQRSYPQEYPALYSEITVSGDFYCYELNGLSYLGLKDAVLE